jgi:hypothetical protein
MSNSIFSNGVKKCQQLACSGVGGRLSCHKGLAEDALGGEAGTLNLRGNPYPTARKKENWCGSIASTFALGSIRSGALAFPHSATAVRGGRPLVRAKG